MKSCLKSEYIDETTWSVILMTLPEKTKLALVVALQTGMRISDVLELQPQNLDGCALEYTAKKTGKRRRVEIMPETARQLSTLCGGQWIFASRKNPTKHIARQTIWHALKKAAKMLGVRQNVTPHSARKTYAVEEFAAHGLEAAQNELQHDRISTTLIYAFANKLAGDDDGGDASKNVDAFAALVAREVVRQLTEQKFVKRRAARQ